MGSKKTGQPGENETGDARKQPSTDMIETSLRSFYDSILEQGTPDRLIGLLEKLDAAEKAAAKKDK